MARILLVEDDPFLVDIYSTKLKQAGFDLDAVDHGDKVLEIAEKNKPDLILLDVVLPHIDGWDILEKLHTQETTKDIPVVILSNLGQKEEIEKGLRLGASQYLIKAHYAPSQVVSEVQKLLSNK